MALRIDPDHRRFRDIVRGKIKQDLRKYVSQGELIGRKGKDVVSIPLPQINIPRFHFGSKNKGGVGQGEGDVGDSLGQGDPNQDGEGKAGDQAGEHALEVELSLDELAQIMGEELQLPRIEPKGKQRIISQKDRYVGIRRADYDTQHTGVLKLDRDWNIVASVGFGQPGAPVFNAVHDIAVGKDGSIYVAETRTKRVVKLRPVK